MSRSFPARITGLIRDGLSAQGMMILFMALLLGSTVFIPTGILLSKAFTDADGKWIGAANIVAYLSEPHLLKSVTNTLAVSSISSVISVTLAFLFAYAISRCDIPAKRFFRYVALIPLFAPTMMHAIALIYLFGNKGIVSMLFLKLSEPFLHGAPIPLTIYGPVGIVASQIIYTFPQVFLILSISLTMTDNRLYEAAESLGASPFRRFVTVTLPSVRYGLVNSLLAGFIMGFTDFGSAKVIGGNFNVLATDIYKHVIGQQNMSMGATVGILLLVPSLAAFAIDRVLERRQSAVVTSKSVPYRPRANAFRDRIFLAYCATIALVIFIFLAVVAIAALVRVWPYRLDLTLGHFYFERTAGGGLSSFVNSILVAAMSAVAGVALCFPFAYLCEKCRVLPALRRFSYYMSLIPLALPGLVIGLSFIFMFNTPGFTVPLVGATFRNPLVFLYGTPAILVISNIVHFMSVPFISATSRLRSFDREIENVSESLGVRRSKTFFRITLPMSLPAVFDMASYFFVNSMVTVSAVIFLYSPDFRLAAVSIVNMDDAGDTAEAAAMSALIILTNIAFKIIYDTATRRTRAKSERWMSRCEEEN